MFLKPIKMNRKWVCLIDIALICMAYTFAYYLRFDLFPFPRHLAVFSSSLLVVVCAKALVFLSSGMYRSLWRYASLRFSVLAGAL